MKRFAVALDARFFMAVDAPDHAAAKEIAYAALTPQVAGLPGITFTAIETMVREATTTPGGPVTYVCQHCGVSAPKQAWGPGWITCPSCGKRPPSAAEYQAQQIEPCGCIGGVHDHG